MLKRRSFNIRMMNSEIWREKRFHNWIGVRIVNMRILFGKTRLRIFLLFIIGFCFSVRSTWYLGHEMYLQGEGLGQMRRAAKHITCPIMACLDHERISLYRSSTQNYKKNIIYFHFLEI